jgi:phosphinothricin acetyltransferase
MSGRSASDSEFEGGPGRAKAGAAPGVVRAGDPERDAERCLEIYAPFVADTAVSFEVEVPRVDEFRRRMRALAPTHPWLVLERDGELAGFAYASPHRERAGYRWAVDVTIYVSSSHRRCGVGRRLYGELFECLRAQGFQVACAGVALPNDASLGLHRGLGFESVGVYRRIGWKLGAWHDVEWLQLELNPERPSAPAEPGAPPSASG